jgi:hypothetical protein
MWYKFLETPYSSFHHSRHSVFRKTLFFSSRTPQCTRKYPDRRYLTARQTVGLINARTCALVTARSPGPLCVASLSYVHSGRTTASEDPEPQLEIYSQLARPPIINVRAISQVLRKRAHVHMCSLPLLSLARLACFCNRVPDPLRGPCTMRTLAHIKT